LRQARSQIGGRSLQRELRRAGRTAGHRRAQH